MRLVFDDKTLVEYKNENFYLYPKIKGTALEIFVKNKEDLVNYLYKRLSLRPHSIRIYAAIFNCDEEEMVHLIESRALSIEQIAELLDGCRTPTDPVVIYKD